MFFGVAVPITRTCAILIDRGKVPIGSSHLSNIAVSVAMASGSSSALSAEDDNEFSDNNFDWEAVGSLADTAQQMHAAAPPPSSRAATAVAERDRHREKAECPEPRVV